MLQTFHNAFWASLITALWLGHNTAYTLCVAVAVAALNATLARLTAAIRDHRFNRRRTDSLSLAHGKCPICECVDVEVTSDTTIECHGCYTTWRLDGEDGLVTRNRK